MVGVTLTYVEGVSACAEWAWPSVSVLSSIDPGSLALIADS